MSKAIPPSRSRDALLDLWRGIALLDMAWVHLAVYPVGLTLVLHDWIAEHTRFAAGCFVLLSGMTVARVFGGRLAAGGQAARATVVRLLRRALLLLVVGRLASLAFGWIQAARLLEPGYRADPPDLFRVLTFADAGATGGLLLLYAVLLSLTPLLEALRARIGGIATVALSFAVFEVAHASGGPAHFPPWTFPWAHWQPLFVLGYVVSPHLDRLRDASGRVSASWRTGVTVATFTLFAVRSGPALGLDPRLVPDWSFGKVPLQPAELAWYVLASAFVLTWSAWAYERHQAVRAATEWICRLGRWSLVIYVTHLFFEMPIAEFVIFARLTPGQTASMLVVMALAMHAVALAAERVKAWHPAGVGLPSPLSLLRRVLPPGGLVGAGAAMAATAVIVMVQIALPRPSHWEQGTPSSEVATSEDPTSDGGESLVPTVAWEHPDPDDSFGLTEAEFESDGTSTLPPDEDAPELLQRLVEEAEDAPVTQ